MRIGRKHSSHDLLVQYHTSIINKKKAWERGRGEGIQETREVNGKTHQHSIIGQSVSLAHAFSVPVGRRNLHREVDYGHLPFRFLLCILPSGYIYLPRRGDRRVIQSIDRMSSKCQGDCLPGYEVCCDLPASLTRAYVPIRLPLIRHRSSQGY